VKSIYPLKEPNNPLKDQGYDDVDSDYYY
jgi:hypothetical protein